MNIHSNNPAVTPFEVITRRQFAVNLKVAGELGVYNSGYRLEVRRSNHPLRQGWRTRH